MKRRINIKNALTSKKFFVIVETVNVIRNKKNSDYEKHWLKSWKQTKSNITCGLLSASHYLSSIVPSGFYEALVYLGNIQSQCSLSCKQKSLTLVLGERISSYIVELNNLDIRLSQIFSFFHLKNVSAHPKLPLSLFLR